ncbi:MAG: endolytic transglycosylase MltG [Mycobacterium leprae]
MARIRRKRSLQLMLLILLVIALWQADRWVGVRLGPAAPGSTQSMTIVIPAGATTRTVGDLLASRHLIVDSTVFRYYTRLEGLEGTLKSGEYQLSPGMTLRQILDRLSRGETVVHKFTIPEGTTVKQMADLLASQHVVDKQQFLQAAAASKLNAQYLPPDVRLTEPLEGYLFPDTYDFKPGITPDQVLQLMYNRWQQEWTPDRVAQAKAMGLSVHQAVTLAAIVEREARVAQERPVIAGVYLNRLQIGMKLDADPTVYYAVGKLQTQELTLEDLQSPSPYNTYRTNGLPPGPIAAPGAASTTAALHPAKHAYLYFVAKQDGTGEHYFAETLAEQSANIAKAAANAQATAAKAH